MKSVAVNTQFFGLAFVLGLERESGAGGLLRKRSWDQVRYPHTSQSAPRALECLDASAEAMTKGKASTHTVSWENPRHVPSPTRTKQFLLQVR
jgi:hypothetical protein